MYGQGHLVPIGTIDLQPQQPYGYMAPAALPPQGVEGMPLPVMPMAVAPQPAHLQQQGALPMYADYHTAASAQVRASLGVHRFRASLHSRQVLHWFAFLHKGHAPTKPGREHCNTCKLPSDAA